MWVPTVARVRSRGGVAAPVVRADRLARSCRPRPFRVPIWHSTLSLFDVRRDLSRGDVKGLTVEPGGCVLGRQGFVEVSGAPLASRRRDGRRRAADAHMVRRCSSVLVAACADHSAPSRRCHSSCLSRHRPRNACGSLGSSWQRRSAPTSQVRGSASVTAPTRGVQQGSGNGVGAQSALATALV